MTTMSDKLFDLAVSLIRRGDSFTDILREIESAGPPGVDAMAVYSSASAYAEEMQKGALQAAVSAFKRGESYAEVCRKLIELKFSPFDAECVANRAQDKAEKELAKENLDDGLLTLSEKTE
jgi:hypothetical protein